MYIDIFHVLVRVSRFDHTRGGITNFHVVCYCVVSFPFSFLFCFRVFPLLVPVMGHGWVAYLGSSGAGANITDNVRIHKQNVDTYQAQVSSLNDIVQTREPSLFQ